MSLTTTPAGEPAGEVEELRQLVAQLQERIATLEQKVTQQHPELSEETVLAISAAVAAYLGKRARIKQVHLLRGGGWVSQARAGGQVHLDPRGMR